MPYWKSGTSPRKRGRPLTYEEKWMVYSAFESFERNKLDKSIIVVDDPYAVTSSYTGVARTTVANIVKSVRESGSAANLIYILDLRPQLLNDYTPLLLMLEVPDVLIVFKQTCHVMLVRR